MIKQHRLAPIFGWRKKARIAAAADVPFTSQTQATTVSPEAASVARADAPMQLNWKLGDVILDSYEIKPLREGSEPHYVEGGMGRAYAFITKGGEWTWLPTWLPRCRLLETAYVKK